LGGTLVAVFGLAFDVVFGLGFGPGLGLDKGRPFAATFSLATGLALAFASLAFGLDAVDLVEGVDLRRSFAITTPAAAERPRMVTNGSDLAGLR
jgi:hypothetical protein